MPLNPPTQRDIVNRVAMRLAGRPVALTDLTVISTLRILLEEMHAPEWASLHAGLVRAVNGWYLQTAQGADLDRRLADFGLTRPPAENAYGTVDISLSTPGNVPAGTVVRTDPQDGTPPRRFQVSPNPAPDATLGELDGSWYVDGTRTIDIAALDAGSAGNVSSGTITAPDTSIANLVSLTNSAPILNGRDAASDAEYRQYFRDWVASLTRGTRGSLIYALRNYTDPATGRRIHSVAFDEWGGGQLLGVPNVDPSLPARTVALRIWIDEGAGAAAPGQGLADPALVQAIQTLVDGGSTGDGWRAAGVPTAVLAATAVAVPVNVDVDIDRAYSAGSVLQAIRNAALAFFAQLPVAGVGLAGELVGQLSVPRLFNAIDDLPGVLRTRLASPRADVPVPIGSKATAWTMNVTGQVV